MDLPPDAVPVVRAFADGLRDLLGDDLAGIYLYGAITFPDSRDQVQDIDFHVVLRQPLTDARRSDVRRLTQDLVRDFGRWAEELDGYYILLDDMAWSVPPRHQIWPLSSLPIDTAWALHCAHIHADRFIAPYGPDPREIYPVPSWPDLRVALFGEIRFVDQHTAEAPAYAVLNAVRILYSFTMQDVVVSKRGAATWGVTVLPEERHLIEAALRWYRGDATAEDRRTLEAQVASFVRSIWQAIASLPAAQ